ncbi:MAG: SOS response-associated peptidase [Acidobacteriota bacterium]
MCGRYTLTGYQRIPDLFEVDDVRIGPRFNIAPTQDVPAVRLGQQGQRRLDLFHWGLIPFWAKDPKMGARMINARSETVDSKPAFRNAFARRRCLIPADGYYEWRKLPDGKQPFLFRLKDGGLFAFAGLWERWKSPEIGERLSCTILTTSPNPLAAAAHDRMPVILPPEGHRLWLDPGSAPELLKELMIPYQGSDLEAFPVSRTVNNPRNEAAECVEPVGERI